MGDSLALIVTCGALCPVISEANDAPVVVWASYPAGAGEHVLVHGGAWGTNPCFVLEGPAYKGRNFHARTRIDVKRATQFSFTRGDRKCLLLLDGKELSRPGAGLGDAAEVTLQPGGAIHGQSTFVLR